MTPNPSPKPPNPAIYARFMLALILLTTLFQDFLQYRHTFLIDPSSWSDVIQGTAHAPEQYRIGVVEAAFYLARLLHLQVSYTFTLIDGLCALIGCYLLLISLEQSPTFKSADARLRWLGLSAYLVLIAFYLSWLFQPQRPESLPSMFFLASVYWLYLKHQDGSPRPGVSASILLLIVVESFIRSDVAFTAAMGGILSNTLRSDGRNSKFFSRAFPFLLGAAFACLTHLYLARWLFRSATYGNVKMWQVIPNVIHITRWPPFIIFLVPTIWLFHQVYLRRANLNLVVYGSILYLVLWMTLGKIDEVRIFLPFACALVPLTVEVFLGRLQQASSIPASTL